MGRRAATGLIAGLGWGLALSLLDGLPLLWQGALWPHLGERLLALAYLATIYGLIGAVLGAVLVTLLSVVARLFPHCAAGPRRTEQHPVAQAIGLLAAGTLALAWGQRFQPGPVGWVLIAALAAAAGAGAAWLSARFGRPRSSPTGPEALPRRGSRALPIVIASLYLVALAAVASAALARGVQARPRAASSAAAPPGAGKPNILLITVSGIRADHLGAYGYDQAVSPNLDALAARGVRFGQAIAPGSWSRPSVAALLTSIYPGALGYRRDPQDFAAPAPDSMRTTLAEALSASGYRTGAILASQWLNAAGFAQGFGSFEAARDQEPFDKAPMRARMLGHLLGCAKESTACCLYLEGRELLLGTRLWPRKGGEAINDGAAHFLDMDTGRPFLLWVQYDDVLPPYDSSEPFRPIAEGTLAGSLDLLKVQGHWDLISPNVVRGLLEPQGALVLASLYDGEVRRVDHLVGELLAMLDARGLTGRTVVVVTSDHGQAFGDHGSYSFGQSLYDEIVRVPLIVAGPGVTAAGQTVETPVSLIDLAPTLAALAGTELSAEVQGLSLVPGLQGKAIGERPVFAEGLYCVPFNQHAIRSGGYALIHRDADGQVELYDMRSDPAQLHDLAAQSPGVVSDLFGELSKWQSQMRELELSGLPHSGSDDATAGILW